MKSFSLSSNYKLSLFALACTLAFITSCGSAGGGASSSIAVEFSGAAADGYLRGATVCFDRNENNACDPGETRTTTGSGGVFSFQDIGSDAENYPIVVEVSSSTFDEGANEFVSTEDGYVLAAPAGKGATTDGKGFVSPFTSLVINTMRGDGTLSPETAQSRVKQQLNISSTDVEVDLFADFVKQSQSTQEDTKVAYKAVYQTAQIVARFIDLLEDTAETNLKEKDIDTTSVSAQQTIGVIVAETIIQEMQEKNTYADTLANFTENPFAEVSDASADEYVEEEKDDFTSNENFVDNTTDKDQFEDKQESLERQDTIQSFAINAGNLNFYNSSSRPAPVPDDANVYIWPNFSTGGDASLRVYCPVESNGSFGGDILCVTEADNTNDIQVLIDAATTTYQLLVYQDSLPNTYGPQQCNEDWYKFVGDNETSWTSISIAPSDFLRRSNDPGCNESTPRLTDFTVDVGNVAFMGVEPSNPYVRIWANDTDLNDHYSQAVYCPIRSDGSFAGAGNSCYTYSDATTDVVTGNPINLGQLFAASSTYDVVVFENSIQSDRHHWEDYCTEEVIYKELLGVTNWDSISVSQADVQPPRNFANSCN